MTYSESLKYLYKQLPMFHRIGAAAYKANLNNTYSISNLLKHPEKKFKCIHIAGTNGKGSVSHALSSVLQAAGYKTGLYTSPHLIDFRERIRINGKIIAKKNVVNFIHQYKSIFKTIEPSFFEWTVGLAFNYFANEKVDIAVIETGLGGRLDSTNIVTPVVSVITNISFDHQNLLGNTLQEIATEKAGIIKPKTPVIIGEFCKETNELFTRAALNNQSEIIFADQQYTAQLNAAEELFQNIKITNGDSVLFQNLKTDLAGNYQLKNITTIVAVVEKLKRMEWKISDSHFETGMQNIRINTGLMGRWQHLSSAITAAKIIADVAHNAAGIKAITEQIAQQKFNTLHFVIGFVSDKDINTILQLLPKHATYYFCKANLPRGLNAETLQHEAKAFGLSGNVYKSVADAYLMAQQNSKTNDLIFIGGSFFTVAEVLPTQSKLGNTMPLF